MTNRRSALLAAASLSLASLALTGIAEAQQKLVVYTSNDSTLNELVSAAFGKEAGIQVDMVSAGSGVVIKRIQSELSATLVVVEHDLPLILAITDHVYCLEAGTVIAHGAPNEMRTNPLVIASYLGTDERATMRSNATLAD